MERQILDYPSKILCCPYRLVGTGPAIYDGTKGECRYVVVSAQDWRDCKRENPSENYLKDLLSWNRNPLRKNKQDCKINTPCIHLASLVCAVCGVSGTSSNRGARGKWSKAAHRGENKVLIKLKHCWLFPHWQLHNYLGSQCKSVGLSSKEGRNISCQ